MAMNGNLIYKDVLQKKLGMAQDCKDCPNCTSLKFCGLSPELMEVCDVISDSPGVDFPLIVSCRDCSKGIVKDNLVICCDSQIMRIKGLDDFCSSGVKKNE